MCLPIIVPLTSVEIKKIHKADAKPTSEDGYEIVLLKDLTYTKLWIEFKIVEG